MLKKNNNAVLNFFESQYGKNLTNENRELILNSCKTHEFKAKEIVFTAGKSNTRHYFIQNGLMRLFLIDTKGKEFNILFAKENQVIGDLITPKPARFSLAAIEKTLAYSISESEFIKLKKLFPTKVEEEENSYLKRSYLFLQKRLISILTKTAEENYLELLNKYSELIQRIPQYHIAGYLGVSPEFLSKIIARIHKNKL